MLRQQKDVAIFVGGAQDDDDDDGSGNGGPHSHGGSPIVGWFMYGKSFENPYDMLGVCNMENP